MPTDNGNLEAKLKLRRHFLAKYHADGYTVFDCCQGDGVLWKRLRQSGPPCLRYWGVDVKRKKGRLAVDSIDVLSLGVDADVVDIDTYGSPWRHYEALLKSLSAPCTVFLTLGNGGQTTMQPQAHGVDILSLPTSTPQVLAGRIARQHAVRYWLTSSCEYGIMPVEIKEAPGGATARYFGVHLQPERDHARKDPDRVD